MKRKHFISLTVALAFTTLGISGLLMFFDFKDGGVKTTHVIFGLTFIGFAIFHIINNWSSLVAYFRDRVSRKIQKEFMISAAIIGVVLLGTGLNLDLFQEIAHFGESFRERPPRDARIVFQEINTNKESNGTPLSIMIRKDRDVVLPVMAIWVEDTSHQFVENLFVPSKSIKLREEGEDIRHILQEGEFELVDLSNDALPDWQAKAAAKKATFEGATPTEDVIIHTKTIATGAYTVVMEIQNEGKNELYTATITPGAGDGFKLKSANGTLITNALVALD